MPPKDMRRTDLRPISSTVQRKQILDIDLSLPPVMKIPQARRIEAITHKFVTPSQSRTTPGIPKISSSEEEIKK